MVLYFSWQKLDPAAPETKALVTQYWKWEGTDKDGRKFNQVGYYVRRDYGSLNNFALFDRLKSH